MMPPVDSMGFVVASVFAKVPVTLRRLTVMVSVSPLRRLATASYTDLLTPPERRPEALPLFRSSSMRSWRMWSRKLRYPAAHLYESLYTYQGSA